MITAVIFDFGGVITSSPFEAFNRLEADRGLPLDFIRRLNAANPDTNAWARFERSEITAVQFDEAFDQEARVAGHSLRGADVIACLYGSVRPDMLEALRRISARLKTGCITNNVATERPEQIGRTAAVQEAMSLFHHVIESSKAGIRKPDPRIYAMMCEALDVAPANCVYLDDLGINLKPARAMGMATIKVESGPQALRELQSHIPFALQ
ncbi:MAG TPA: HAD family hydrolase [Alphaproteobacteria bacterium]|nr:HAD family hydrolase [Alphaproteobacteria bacterium]